MNLLSGSGLIRLSLRWDDPLQQFPRSGGRRVSPAIPPTREEVIPLAKFPMTACRAMYVCRSCGYECAYPSRFWKCPVCGIKWG